MCTVVVLVRPGHAWPLTLAANRDERLHRPWDAPGPYWPGVVTGRDRLGGGTWMALGMVPGMALGSAVVGAVLNRPGSLGPAPGKLSRGALPLMAARHDGAEAAARALAGLDAGRYRPFNLVVADREGAWFLRGLGAGAPEAAALAPGLHVVTAHDPNDPASPRVARHLPRFRGAPPPDEDDGAAWRALLADGAGPAGSELNVPARDGFGTVCSSLLVMGRDGAVRWLFVAGPPDAAPFRPVALTS